jgi:hypothetical protein
MLSGDQRILSGQLDPLELFGVLAGLRWPLPVPLPLLSLDDGVEGDGVLEGFELESPLLELLELPEPLELSLDVVVVDEGVAAESVEVEVEDLPDPLRLSVL